MVTKTLLHLIRTGLDSFPGLKSPEFRVTAEAPGQFPGKGISLYLYYLGEDTHFKNMSPSATSRDEGIGRTIALNLYYIVSASSGKKNREEDMDEELTEQRLLGAAMKAFHDTPVINAHTKIDGKQLAGTKYSGTDFTLRIELLNLQPQEAIAFWAAGSLLPQLCAFYRVSLIIPGS